MKITCSKSELRKFKVRAGKHYPHEYMEMLFGIRGRGKVGCDILAIYPVPHVGGKHHCHSTDEIWDQHVEDIAEDTGLTFLGSIHTHNGNVHESGPSPDDNSDAVRCLENYFAIDTISRQPSGRLRHSVKFWFPQFPIQSTLT
jgi:hypothetical protein